MDLVILGGIVFVASLIFTYLFRFVAISKGVLAKPNFRTLHEYPTPSGGGFAFSLVFVVSVVSLGGNDYISSKSVVVFGVGGGLAAFFGFVDDLVDIRAKVKLMIQCALVVWVLSVFDGGPLAILESVPIWLAWIVSSFLLLWLINLYNFVDGIDGMAASGAVFISITLLISLVQSGSSSDLPVLLSLLAASSMAFLFFNWPPASVFMGDSGSVFLGYIFGALIVYSVSIGEVSFWTWLVVFGYFLGDTTTTTTIRVLRVKKWYGAHRSHAYQNLARIWGSHLKVTGGVLIYHLFWLLPLAIWSAQSPGGEPVAAVLALLPSVLWAIRYGPLLSSA